jgi:hypothetical protein
MNKGKNILFVPPHLVFPLPNYLCQAPCVAIFTTQETYGTTSLSSECFIRLSVHLPNQVKMAWHNDEGINLTGLYSCLIFQGAATICLYLSCLSKCFHPMIVVSMSKGGALCYTLPARRKLRRRALG